MDSLVKSTNRADSAVMTLGIYLMSLTTIGAGILDLVWRDFDPSHQPFGGLGYYMPGRAVFACIAGVWLIFAGIITLWRRTERLGGFAMAAIYFIFGLLSLPHFYTLLHKYGFHFTIIVGVTSELFLQLLVVGGCILLDSSEFSASLSRSKKAQLLARWMFGIGGILTGVGHLINTRGIVPMIPKWMPLDASVWVVVTGIGFILAGVAILTGILDLLAARLLALMLFIFQIILVPIIFKSPHVHQAWGGTAFNLATAGSVCILAASIASRRKAKYSEVQSRIATV